MRIGLALVLACMALAACGPEAATEKQDAPAAREANIMIGPNGAAGISTALPLTLAAVAASAPGFTAVEAQDQIEGDPFRKITLRVGDEIMFDVLPTADGAHVHSIVTFSASARGPNEEIIGEAKFGTAPATQNWFCQSERVEGAPGFSCSNAEDGKFWRVYRLPAAYDGPSEPFEAIDPDFALDAVLYEMRWIAPRVEPSR